MSQPTSILPQLTAQDGTATASAGAATLNAQSGVITTESLSTAAGADYTLTLTNSNIEGASTNVLVQVEWGSNTQGTQIVKSVTPSAGQVVIVVRNNHATSAFNGTLKIRFLAF